MNIHRHILSSLPTSRGRGTAWRQILILLFITLSGAVPAQELPPLNSSPFGEDPVQSIQKTLKPGSAPPRRLLAPPVNESLNFDSSDNDQSATPLQNDPSAADDLLRRLIGR